MIVRIIICLTLLLVPTLSDSIVVANVDFTESLNQASLPLLERVEHKAEITYTFTLSGDNNQNKYPELDITFTLPYDQYVKVKYHTAYHCATTCFL